MKAPIASFVILALSLAGCSKAVTIIEPVPPISTQLTTFKVKFSPYFAPGSFNAQFDGNNVTPGFVPTAAAGGTSTMHLPDTPEGLTGGALINSGGPPPRNFPVGTLPSDIHFTPASGGPSLPGVPPSGGASGGKPTPNIALFTHQLQVSGQCNGMLCATTDELTFFPLHLVGNPTTLDIKIGQKVQATVETYPANSTPIQVQVRPSSVSVSLNGQAPGTLITVKIPANGTSAPFLITGMVSSKLLLFLEASGTQRGSIQGTVKH